MIDALCLDRTDQTQSQAVVAGATDLDKIFRLVGDANHLCFRHRNRTAGDMADDVRFDFVDDLPARDLAHA